MSVDPRRLYAGDDVGGLFRRMEGLERQWSGPWISFADDLGYLNGWEDSGDPWLTSRIRWSLYHKFDYIINIDNGTPGSAIVEMPDVRFYDPDGDIPIHAFDNDGLPLALKMRSDGFLVHVGP